MLLDNRTRSDVMGLVAKRGLEPIVLEPVQGEASGPDGRGEFVAGYLVVTREAIVIVYIRSQDEGVNDLKVLCTCPFGNVRNLYVGGEGLFITFDNRPLFYGVRALTPNEEWAALVDLIVGMVQTAVENSAFLVPEEGAYVSTWDQVRRYVTATHADVEDDGRELRLLLSIPSDVIQPVIIRRHALMGEAEEWLTIESPIAERATADLDEVLNGVEGQLAGALSVRNGVLMMKHSTRLAGLTESSLDRPMMLVAASAARIGSLLAGAAGG